MPCYHPHTMEWEGNYDLKTGEWKGKYTENGKKRYIMLKGEKHEIPKDMAWKYIRVPCGKCIGCRLDYSRSWADRMLLELETAKKGMFVTLTYNNEHVPFSMLDEKMNPCSFTLDKRDCQLWMKRLRKQFGDIKIRFYLAGEYGSKTHRPHYHAILFGVSIDDLDDKKIIGRNELGQIYYSSERIQKTWRDKDGSDIGFTLVSDVSWKTCAYVARYVTKKLNGLYELDYAVRNCDKEFSLMSRRPGIGSEYLNDHPEVFDKSSIVLGTNEGSKKIMIPKYFYRKLELQNPEAYAKLMEDKKELAIDKEILKLQQTDLGLVEYLEVEERNKLESLKALRRNKVL